MTTLQYTLFATAPPEALLLYMARPAHLLTWAVVTS